METKTKTKGRVSEEDIRIGRHVKIIRKVKGMTQDAVAKKIGVTFQQVQKYEQGTNRISLSCAVKMANIYGVKLEDLLPPSVSTHSKSHILLGEIEFLRNCIKENAGSLLRATKRKYKQ